MTSPDALITQTRNCLFEYTIRLPLPDFTGAGRALSTVSITGATEVEDDVVVEEVGVGSTAAIALPDHITPQMIEAMKALFTAYHPKSLVKLTLRFC